MGILFKLNKSVYSNCKSYVYKSGGNSLLDNLFDAFWNICVKFVPKSITPNLLTLLGFLCSTIAFILTFVFDTQNKKYDYIYIYAGIFLFLYQTFDAVDGKQARRTNTSSPLGQLFDHGCDAITTSFFVFIACKAAGFPKSLIYYILLAIVQIQGYMFSWMEYHTKVFNTSVGKIGTTESHVLVITMCILRGLKGAAIFQRTTLRDVLPKSLTSVLCKCVLSVSMNYVILIPVLFFTILSISRCTYIGMQNVKKKKSDAIMQLAVVYVFSLMQYYFYYTNVTPKTELICFSIIALYSCFYNLFINLSTILKIKMDLIPIPVIFYYLSIFLIFLKRNTKYKFLKHPLLKDNYILYYMFFFGAIYLLDYAHTIITNICKELNITFILNKKYKKK
ncbi:choline/ethanolaminephosphotransferase, putative [Plasmodium sp. gorilla clade G2]|uniref:choline/ethanolaminephosphotransferase, putative n=1 Tax=Plasmodium sp. gorilla clade G2 TaxID=880535 RepID=UPI000D20078A|nr:choline/ethanolaminephosphotransferase, putative [Plasmodium sp. gorilla clade G2]SOV12692.1 choline/ethanolaminephosphotransferase, putative [Plasmodium sp. gorilla clade G2]